jgi:hypothetical protein
MVTQAKLTPTTRDLAQAGTLAGAILGAPVGADPFDVRNRTAWVKDVDYFAIALWVAAVLLFLFARVDPHQPAQLRSLQELGEPDAGRALKDDLRSFRCRVQCHSPAIASQ